MKKKKSQTGIYGKNDDDDDDNRYFSFVCVRVRV